MKLPETLPAYTITPSLLPPFSVRFEEMPGWMIVPRLGESRSWGLYEAPGGRRTEYCEESVVGRAQVHGIEGVEITATQYNTENYYRTGAIDRLERRFIAQLTDTHCRVLAESHVEDGVRKLFTFLDGDPFLNNWGFGENNCGSQVQIAPKGLLCREGNRITSAGAATIDVTGRYIVELCGKRYDTICLTDTDTFEDGILSETYIDADGHTVLWRRFNKNDWALQHFGPRTWQERLPDNETRLVNDALYVHWYDCVTDYIG